MNNDLSVIDYQSKLVTYVFSPSHFQINAKFYDSGEHQTL